MTSTIKPLDMGGDGEDPIGNAGFENAQGALATNLGALHICCVFLDFGFPPFWPMNKSLLVVGRCV